MTKLRVILKFMTSQNEQLIIATHVLPIFGMSGSKGTYFHVLSRSKGNQTINFGQLIEYNVRKIFLQVSCRK